MKVIKEELFRLLIVCFLIGCNVKKTENKVIEKNKQKDELHLRKDLLDKDNYKENTRIFEFLGKSYNSFKKTIVIDDVFYTAAILPKDYYITKNLDKKDSLDYYRNKLKKEEVVQIDFQHVDKKDLFKGKSIDYGTYIKYMSSKIKNDFYVITNKGDTIKPKGVFFERNYTLAPYKRVLVYFSFPNEIKKEMKFVYNDKLFEKGFIKFLLKK
ncbi:hypothetical protein KUL156_57980 [Alteromonas sp. KUL156]|nr:hypothetical protein KUL154_03030 [Alteromonas sp. KUL154]GFE03206.1 hypothetical protein KUL156_57980 [Alteromonas sp. KUL156]